MLTFYRPKPVEERPKWLDDPRGAYGRPDCLPKDFPKGQGDIGANTFSNNTKTKELGAYAEYAVVLDTQVALIPSNVNFLEAASLPKVSLTSIKALAWYGGARNRTFINSTVLILGGS